MRRLLLRSPGFSLVAILALAIGIGANTAIFSVINTLLLQRLPYRDADRLAIVWEHNTVRDRRSNVVGPANFIHWREMNQVFEDLAAVTITYSVTVTGSGDPEELQAQSISAELFQILGVQPALGRGFTAAENVPGSRIDRHQRPAVEAPLRRRSGRSSTNRSCRRARRTRSSASCRPASRFSTRAWTCGCRSGSRRSRGRRAAGR